MENLETYNKKTDELSNELSIKRNYVRGIEMIKKEEPVADEKDYEEEYEEEEEVDGEMQTVTKTRTIVVPKLHKEWEEKLTNHQQGYAVSVGKIATLRSEIDELEEALLA